MRRVINSYHRGGLYGDKESCQVSQSTLGNPRGLEAEAGGLHIQEQASLGYTVNSHLPKWNKNKHTVEHSPSMHGAHGLITNMAKRNELDSDGTYL